MSFEHIVTNIAPDTFRIDECVNSLHTYCYLLLGQEKAMLIDTGFGLGSVYDTVNKLTQKPVIVVHTHAHADHIGDDNSFEALYLAQEDFALLQENWSAEFRGLLVTTLQSERKLALADDQIASLINRKNPNRYIAMQAGQQFDIGGRVITVIPTPGHTPGSVCFLEEARGQLYTGDTICDEGVLLSFGYSTSLVQFRDMLIELQKQSGAFHTLFPGHHKPVLTNEIIGRFIACADSALNGANGNTFQVSGGVVTHQNLSIAYLK